MAFFVSFVLLDVLYNRQRHLIVTYKSLKSMGTKKGDYDGRPISMLIDLTG